MNIQYPLLETTSTPPPRVRQHLLRKKAGFKSLVCWVQVGEARSNLVLSLRTFFAERCAIHVRFDMVGDLGDMSFGITTRTRDWADGR